MNNDIISKIRKLLDLGTHETTNANMAEMALAHARRLALEHDLDLTVLARTETVVQEKIDGKRIRVGARLPVSQKFVGNIIGRHFNVRVFTAGTREQGRQVVFIGKPQDITIAEYVHDFLTGEFMRLWHKAKDARHYSTDDRNTYFLGVYRGLDAKLAREKEVVLEARPVDVQNQYALVLVDNEKRMQVFAKGFFNKITTAPGLSVTIRNNNALQDGKQAGSNIQINRGLNDREETMRLH